MYSTNTTTVSEYSFVLPFEKNFNVREAEEWFLKNYYVSIYFSLGYLVSIYVGIALMKNRPAFDLRHPLAVWNACLALMSIWGAVRVVPELFHVLRHFGFQHSVCGRTVYFQCPVVICWTCIFAYSKVAELVDTAFVVLRKRNLMFLHWFHHSTVLVLAFYVGRDQVAMGRWFMSMNYTVHSVMYSYYALRAMNIKVPQKIAMFITVFQISQMLVGFYVSISAFKSWYREEDCMISGRVATASILLYSFYFFLFLKFFVGAYFRGGFSFNQKKKE